MTGYWNNFITVAHRPAMPPITIYHGGHLDLVTEGGHLAPLVEAFLAPAGQRKLCATNPDRASSASIVAARPESSTTEGSRAGRSRSMLARSNRLPYVRVWPVLEGVQHEVLARITDEHFV
jgi:hypothetical protein